MAVEATVEDPLLNSVGRPVDGTNDEVFVGVVAWDYSVRGWAVHCRQLRLFPS